MPTINFEPEQSAAVGAIQFEPEQPAAIPPVAATNGKGRISSALSSFMQGGGKGIGATLSGLARHAMTAPPLDPTIYDMQQVAEINALPQVEKEKALLNNPLYAAGQMVSVGAEEAFQGNPKFKGEFFADVIPSAAGQMVPTIAAGVGGGPLLGTVQYGLTSGQQGADEAIAAGKPEDADLAFLSYLGLGGASELALGVPARIWKIVRGARAANLDKETARKLILQEFAKSGVREAGQESLEQTGQNIVAQQTFDPNRPTMQGVPESAGAGFLLGGGLGAGVTAVGLTGRKPVEFQPETVSQSQKNPQQNQPVSAETMPAAVSESQSVSPQRVADDITQTLQQTAPEAVNPSIAEALAAISQNVVQPAPAEQMPASKADIEAVADQLNQLQDILRGNQGKALLQPTAQPVAESTAQIQPPAEVPAPTTPAASVSTSDNAAVEPWAEKLFKANDISVQEFADMASRGKLNKATGAPSINEEGSGQNPLSMGHRSGYSLADIAHFYLARRSRDVRSVINQIKKASDPRNVQEVITAFDDFAADAAKERGESERLETLARVTASKPGSSPLTTKVDFIPETPANVVTPAPKVESQPANVGSSPLVDKIAARYREIDPAISETVARKNAAKLASAIEGNQFHDLLRPDNRISRQIYQEITLRKLPKTLKGTKAVAEGQTTAAEIKVNKLAQPKPNLMNRPPPGGWTDADKVPAHLRKPQTVTGNPVTETMLAEKPVTNPVNTGEKRETSSDKTSSGSSGSITDALDAGDKARLAELQARLRKKFGQVNVGVDPEIITIGGEMAGLYVKAGVKQFAEFARNVKQDLPDIWDNLKQHLKSIWEAAAVHHPDIDEPSRAEVARHLETLDNSVKPVDSGAAQEQIKSDEQPMDERGGSAEAGNIEPAGGAVSSERDSGSGRLGGDEPGTTEGMGSGRDADAENAGSSRPDRASESGVSERPAEQSTDGGAIAKRNQRDLRRAESPAVTSSKNYTITDADALGKGGAKTKARDNIEAIKLVKLLEAENRKPTTAEQAKLVRYVGWGGLKGIFDPKNKQFAKEFSELRDLLTPEEYESARRTILDAHYTSQTIIQRGIYAALRRFGFRGGKMIEGGVGIGNFVGLMPEDFKGRTTYLGVEYDPLTAKIAQYLYPEARIINGSFAEAKLARDTFDGSVGNPPFGQQKLYDKDFKDESAHSIHNYFISKEIALLRPGGIMGKVVSRYFLDAIDTSAREFINKQAQFLGAIRLPNTAFKENAGTSVVTDLVFFRKRMPGEEPDTTADWTHTTKIQFEGQDYTVNRWIADHPEMIMGELGKAKNGLHTEFELSVEPREGQDLGADLDKAIEQLPADVYAEVSAETRERLTTPEPREVPDGVKVGNYFENERGELMQRGMDDNMTPTATKVEMPAATADRVRAIIPIRDALNRLVEAERTWDTPEAKIEKYRADLNKAYDAFVKEYGYLNSTTNRRAFYADADNNRVLGLESNYEQGISKATAKKHGVAEIKPSATKAAIFTKRVNAPYQEVTHVDTPKEALSVSLNQRGKVDMEHMAQLVGMSEKEVADALDGLVFKTPRGDWESKEQYLSGDVRQKLKEARDAAIDDPSYQKNIAALEPVIPKDIDPTDIQAPLGAGWIAPEDYAAFARELTGSDPNSVQYIRAKGGWVFSHVGSQKWNTKRMTFGDMMEAMMNGKPVQVWDRTHDDKQIINQEETALAKVKADEIKEAFQSWIWQDKERRDRLARVYNDKFNNYADFRADGSHLTLPGSSALVQLNPHQKNVVWRTMTNGPVLYDHVVGAGKTFAGIASFMEMKRTGQLRKPLFAVPNHLTEQWKTEFHKLYPNANVLAARPSDFTKENRQKMFAKIMTGDFDAVILGHSALKKIGVSPEVERGLIKEMQQEIIETIKEMKAASGKGGGGSRAISQLERTKESLDAKLKKLADIGGRDDVATFDELGIDGLFVDEAHEFKNLFYTTQMQNVAGLGNPAGSARAFDLFLKTRYLRQRYGGKAPTVFATGTPISNSLVEMFTMQRYLQPDVLEKMGLKTLDAWAKVFADVQSVYEVDPTGTGYRMATRLANFQNVGELTAIYKDFADCITMADLQAQAEAAGKRFPVPKVEGGKPDNLVVKRTADQEKYFGIETQEMDEEGNPKYDTEGNPIVSYPKGTILWRVDNMPDDPREDNMLKLTNDARKAGLDMRLIDPNAADHPDSKVNTAAREIAQIYKDNTHRKGTQLVFCDLSVPASAKGKATKRATSEPGELYFRAANNTLEIVPDAKPVEIKAAPDYKFFTYKGVVDWHVVERSTGLSVGKGGSRKAAIEKAERQISNGQDRFKSGVESAKATPEQLAELKATQEIKAPEVAEADDAPAPEEEAGVSMDELLADGSTFSVYDDLKAKLIKAGVPEKEIAFIHDFDTPEKKAKLFKAMNAGDVRVLMGSTPKLGAGTNVQAKLVALHHLDAPWRPSDLEQREGRIIRQGNEFYQQDIKNYPNPQDYDKDPKSFAVKIKRYATALTYDTRMWQLIEHKAAGIEGFRSADRTTRKIEDVSGEAANASDMKAAASGDPNIQKEIQLRNERQKLELLQKAWTRNKIELQNRQAYLRDYDLRYQSAVDAAKALIKTRDENTKLGKDGKVEFEFKLPNGTTTDEKGVPVGELVTAIKSEKRSGYVGKYRGFDIAYTVSGDSLLFSKGREFASNKIITSYATGEEGDKLSGVGLFQRLDNWMRGFDELEPKAQFTRDREKKQLADVQAEAAKEFPKAEEYARIRAEHEQVKSDLLNKKKKVAAPKTDIVDKLEAMKDKSPPKMMGAWIPGLDPETFRAVRNTAIDVAIAGIKAGRKIREAIEDAISYLRDKYQGLDESAARADLLSAISETNDGGDWRGISEQLQAAGEALRAAISAIGLSPTTSNRKQLKIERDRAAALFRNLERQLYANPGYAQHLISRGDETYRQLKAITEKAGFTPTPDGLFGFEDKMKAALTPEEIARARGLADDWFVINQELDKMRKKVLSAVYARMFPEAEDVGANKPKVEIADDWLRAKIEPEPVETPATDLTTTADIVKDRVQGLPNILRDVYNEANKWRQRVANWPSTWTGKEIISYTKDVADNRAQILANRVSKTVLHELNRAFGAAMDARDTLREQALTMAVEAGDKQTLELMHNTIATSQHAGSKWGREAIKAINYAQKNWDRFTPIVDLYTKINDAQVAAENASAIKTLRRESGYVFHLHDLDEHWTHLDMGDGTGGGASSPFKNIRDHATYADAIASGVNPRSMSAVDLMHRRLALGQKLINYRAWQEGLNQVKDPATDMPLGVPVETRIRADGSEIQNVPVGYVKMMFSGQTFGIHKTYAPLFKALTSESALRNGGWSYLMKGAATAKHGMLLFDTFHLGRLAFWNAVTRGNIIPGYGKGIEGIASAAKNAATGHPIKAMGDLLPSHQQGLILLDSTDADIRRMIQTGDLKQAQADALLAQRKTLNLLIDAGLNVGNIGDNIYADWIQKLPIAGTFNRWLFEKYQRGAMTEVGLIEFQRQKKMHPEWTDGQAARATAKAINIRFGNLNAQSWVKSKTVGDLLRVFLLAPQWNEALIRSEVEAVKDAGGFAKGLTQGKVHVGTMGRAVAVAFIGQFIANQLINFLTRGQPTWENPEEGFEAKISAYIPDYVGGGPGFFLNPMTLPMEISHLLLKGMHRKGTFAESALEALRSRESSVGRFLDTFATGANRTGDVAHSSAERVLLAANESAPLPIAGNSLYRMGRQLVTGEKSEQYPGQVQRQAMQTFGIKPDSAPSAEQRIQNLAKEWLRNNSDPKLRLRQEQRDDATYHGDYIKLDGALRAGNMAGARKELDLLLLNKKPETIKRRYEQRDDGRFTGSKETDKAFLKTLTPEQRAQYTKAIQERTRIKHLVFRMLAGVE